MGRPKIKTIESAIDLEKVTLPEESIDAGEVKTEAAEPADSPKQKETVRTKAKTKVSKEKAEKKNKQSIRYTELLKLIDKSKTYSIEEAVALVKKSANTKFDA